MFPSIFGPRHHLVLMLPGYLPPGQEQARHPAPIDPPEAALWRALGAVEVPDDRGSAQLLAQRDALDTALPRLLAEPVFYRVGVHEALRVPGEWLNIEPAEAAGLCAHLNTLLAEDGWRLEFVDPARWYLTGDALPRVPGRISTRALAGQGDDARVELDAQAQAQAAWRRLETELQMLLHEHPIQQQRARRRLPPVNAVRLGGAGVPPKPNPKVSTLYTDDAWAQGLGHWLGIPVRPLLELDVTTASGVVFDPILLEPILLADPGDYLQRRDALQARWVEPCKGQAVIENLLQAA